MEKDEKKLNSWFGGLSKWTRLFRSELEIYPAILSDLFQVACQCVDWPRTAWPIYRGRIRDNGKTPRLAQKIQCR